MILTLPERIVLLNVLPAEGNVITLRVAQQLRMEVALSEEEIAKAELVQDGERMHWKAGADVSKDVEIGEAARGIVVEALKKLNEQSKLTTNHISLYEKFVEAPDKAEEKAK